MCRIHIICIYTVDLYYRYKYIYIYHPSSQKMTWVQRKRWLWRYPTFYINDGWRKSSSGCLSIKMWVPTPIWWQASQAVEWPRNEHPNESAAIHDVSSGFTQYTNNILSNSNSTKGIWVRAYPLQIIVSFTIFPKKRVPYSLKRPRDYSKRAKRT